MDLGHFPNELQVDVVVTMNATIPHSRDFLPRDGGVVGSIIRAEAFGGFAENGDLLNHGALGLEIIPELIVSHFLDELPDGTGRQ